MISWQIGGAKYDTGSAITTDAEGNIIVAGYFQESALFENTEVTGNIGATTLFLAKYTNTGKILWVQKIASTSDSEINDLVLDANGNIYITGGFYSSATFATVTLTSYGAQDIFVAKFNSTGVLQWAQQGGGVAMDYAKALCIDVNGNLYITGLVNGNATFGGNNYIGTGIKAFIVKYNNNGTFQWIRRGGSATVTAVADITVDANGKVAMIGHFKGDAAFDVTTITSAGQMDIFLVQYDSSGNLMWAKRMGGIEDEYSSGVVADSNNNLIIFGSFSGTASFDDKGLVSAGSTDIFLAKLDTYGNIYWIKREGGVSYDGGRSIALDNNNNIYIAGDFYKPTVFGNTTLYGYKTKDAFVAKYNNSGDFLWAKELIEYELTIVLKIAADSQGNAYCTGVFSNKFSADDINFTSRGLNDGFVVRFRD